MNINNNMLEGDKVKFIKSPTHGGPFGSGLPDSIIIHYTAGPNMQSSVKTLTNPRVKASAHLLIDRDGAIVQLVPFNIVSWHAGKSEYNGRKGYNKFSIGIELVNAGPLEKSDNEYVAWYGRKYPASEVKQAIHKNEEKEKYWHTYSQKQLDVLEDVCKLLIDEYRISEILGHDDISPGRKTDPGPAFPMKDFTKKLLGKETDDNTDGPTKRVAVSLLNIRSKPTTSSNKVTDALPQNTKVVVIEEKDGWSKVKVVKKTEGWVVSDYIEQ